VKAFTVKTTNIPCGAAGLTCTKSVEISIDRVVISLIQGADPKINNERVYAGHTKFPGGEIDVNDMYTYVKLDLGLDVIYDTGTRVYVYISRDWFGDLVEGLCGNYNGNSGDDYSGNSMASTVTQLTAGWKTNPFCPEPDISPLFDPCTKNP
jgi:hypothetical protein